MRPLRLDIEGFVTFKDAITLNLADVPFFALVGPTGSGKSTIIDALCFALYGTAPRWPDKKFVSLAMASTTQRTQVVLVFELGGVRYAVLRVLTRSAKGAVGTKQARLIELAPDCPLDGELEDLLEHETESLCESPRGLTAAVEELVGLSFDHFTQSVVLPQGKFADFLHAKKSQRQKLLVSLLGLGVYKDVMQRAGAAARDAAARAATLQTELGEHGGADEDAERAAKERLTQVTTLAGSIGELITPWQEATLAVGLARNAAEESRQALAKVRAVHRPPGLDDLVARRGAATDAVTASGAAEEAADAALALAHDEVEKAGEVGQWQQVVAHHEQLATATTQQANAAERTTSAAAVLADARTSADEAEAAAQAATQRLHEVRVAHAADELAGHMVAGESCPVCLQTVAVLPDRPVHEAMAQAEKEVAAATKRAKEAASALSSAQGGLMAAEEAQATIVGRVAELTAVLAEAPTAELARACLAAAGAAASTANQSAQAAQAARAATKAAREALAALEAEWTTAGTALVTTRDGVAQLGPPPTSGDHAVDWAALEEWASGEVIATEAAIATAEQHLDSTREVESACRDAVVQALAEGDVAVSGDLTEVGARVAVEGARVEASAALARIKETRKQVARLEKQIAEANADAERDRELARLLSANNFEPWLVATALDRLLDEASDSLATLSGGQFELRLSDDGEDILVVDHNDAGQERLVHTLSGGETFQASLALALALSSQLAALSAANRQLDTILLDEGFGTLDPATLDTVAETLEALASEGERTVGIVTHVTDLAQRVPVRFEVTREGSRSRITPVGL